MVKVTAQLFISAANRYGIKITGGSIWDFLRNSKVVYYGGRCPVYQVEWCLNGKRVVVGGNYATMGKPELFPQSEWAFD